MASLGRQEEMGSYADGRFCKGNHAFEPLEFAKPSPFGSRIVSPGTDYTVMLAPDGSGFSFLGDIALTNGDALGKQWFIRDRETNSVWMPFSYVSENDHDEYSTSYLPGSARIRSVNGKIASTLTICSSPTDSYELWLISIQNLSAKERAIAFDVCVSPHAGLTGRMSVSKTGKTIAFGQDEDTWYPKMDTRVIFLGSTVKPSYYHTCSSDFYSANKNLSDTLVSAVEDNPVLGISLELEIPIEGEATFGFCFGASESFETAMATVERYQGTEWIQDAIVQTNNEWKSICSLVKCESSDIALDALVDTWLPYELLTEWSSTRKMPDSLSTVGILDAVRLAAPFSLEVSPGVRDSILDMASRMVSAGMYSVDGLSITALAPEETLWLPYAVADYVIETGDVSILDSPLQRSIDRGCTLRDVCERELRNYLEHRTRTGLPRHPASILPIEVLGIGNEIYGLDSNILQTSLWDDHESELLRYIIHSSDTLTTCKDMISGWFCMNADEDDHGLLLCLYLAITRDILGLRTSQLGIAYAPNASVHSSIIRVSRKLKDEVVSFTPEQASQASSNVLTKPY